MRLKRDVDLDLILFDRVKEEKLNNLTHRERRETLNNVDAFILSTKNQLTGLEVKYEIPSTCSFKIINLSSFSYSFLQNGNVSYFDVRPNLDTNVILDTTPLCYRGPNGTINCSTMIYHDRKTWRRSRNQVDNEIQKLREKLIYLKEIKKHLKQSKPKEQEDDLKKEFNLTSNIFNGADPTAYLAENITNFPNFSDFPEINSTTTVTTTRIQRKRKKLNYPDDISQQNKRRKFKHNFNVTTASDLDYFINVTDWNNVNVTNFPETNYRDTATEGKLNHHRHNHSHRHHHANSGGVSKANDLDKIFATTPNYTIRRNNVKKNTTPTITTTTTKPSIAKTKVTY